MLEEYYRMWKADCYDITPPIPTKKIFREMWHVMTGFGKFLTMAVIVSVIAGFLLALAASLDDGFRIYMWAAFFIEIILCIVVAAIESRGLLMRPSKMLLAMKEERSRSFINSLKLRDVSANSYQFCAMKRPKKSMINNVAEGRFAPMPSSFL